MTTTASAEVAVGVAAAAAAVIPSSVPLEAVRAAAGDRPGASATAVVASFVGSPSAELVVVADAVITEAILAAGGSLTAIDALRPALDAAAGALGSGVLDTPRTQPVGDTLAEADVFALQNEGRTLAWFAVRVRSPRVPAPTAAGVPTQRAGMRVLYDVEMTLTAEIGRTRLPMRQVLELVPGTVLELDRQAGAPADVLVNGRLVARGEVVVVDEDYAVRITEIVSGSDA